MQWSVTTYTVLRFVKDLEDCHYNASVVVRDVCDVCGTQ